MIRARFEYKIGTGSEEYRRHREAVQELWLAVGTDKSGVQERRLMFIRHFLNGNYRSRAITHYCPGPCCCANAEAALNKALVYLPEALLPVKSIRIAQHRWTRLAFGTVAFGSSGRFGVGDQSMRRRI